MHSISFFSWFVFDEFIVKGGEYEHKVGKTLANQVSERRNMINDYLKGRACIESVRESWFQGGVDFELLPWLELFLLFWAFLSSFFAILFGFTAFRAVCWLLRFSFI
jgi:hypothetical protein